MADGLVQIDIDGAGQKIDCESLTVSGQTVLRQRLEVAGKTDVAIADVLNANPAQNAYGVSARVIPTASGTAPVTSVASSITVVTLLAVNTSRIGASFYNDSANILYLKWGANAATSDYTVKMQAGAFYEVPPWPIYTGIITGIWDVATGSCLITELTY